MLIKFNIPLNVKALKEVTRVLLVYVLYFYLIACLHLIYCIYICIIINNFVYSISF